MITIKINNKRYKYNNFDNIVSLDNYHQITYIYCGYNQLTTLPQLQCNSNRTLPNSLQYFDCNNNLLKLKYYKKMQQHNNIKNKKYNNDKQLVNDMQYDYLDSSYHPKNIFCKDKLLFNFDDLFDGDI